MKVLLGHLDWGLGTKGPHSDTADKNFSGQQCLQVVKSFVKNGVKASVSGSCTINNVAITSVKGNDERISQVCEKNVTFVIIGIFR